MKKLFFLIGGLLSSWVISAQIMGQTDVALLLSSEENNGTARYNAMGGAFGALGGDMSASDINPAGLAIFKNSHASATFGIRATDINTSFAGNNDLFEDNYLNINQAGAVLVIDNGFNSKNTKLALGINYTLSNDFNRFYEVTGNTGVSDINIVEFGEPYINLQDDPYLNFDSSATNDIFYRQVDGQFFRNAMAGKNEKLTFSIAAQKNEKLYLGLSIVTHNIDMSQNTLFEHSSNDGNDNLLDASYLQKLRTFGNGIGITIGAIYKPSFETRFGLSYQSPTFYNLTDEYIDDLQIKVSHEDQLYTEFNDLSISDYQASTPGRITGSFAYLFGKEGLISFDYTYKDYSNVKLRPSSDFINENEGFRSNLKGTSQFKVGAEWRLDKKISIRGGYMFEENPFKEALETDHIEGYSLGLGLKIGKRTKLDLAYQNTSNTGFYNFVNGPVESANLDFNTGKATATLVFSL